MSMNGWAAELINQEVADKVGKCWGVWLGHALKDPGPCGELRTCGNHAARECRGFTAVTCTSRATHSSYVARNRKPAWKA
jgi:putative flavoprotein involved in K+ transport